MTTQDWLREQASHRDGALTGDPIFARELRAAADRLDELEMRLNGALLRIDQDTAVIGTWQARVRRLETALREIRALPNILRNSSVCAAHDICDRELEAGS